MFGVRKCNDNLSINDSNNGNEGNSKYQFVRKTNIRKKPPLYDLQQIVLQQKRQNNTNLREEQKSQFDDEFVNMHSATEPATATTRSFSIDDIFFTNDIEQQQQQQQTQIQEEKDSANKATNPFCDKNNSYFSVNVDNADPFNHSSSIQQQQQNHNHNNININLQKFTPLALAAHATAMAVLQKDYHFNNDHNKRVSFSDEHPKKQQQQEQHYNIFKMNNNQFNVNDNEDDDDDWFNNRGLQWRAYERTSNENENPNDMKYKSIIGQQQEQTPSKSEYNQNSIYDVYNTTWCTNDLHKYNNNQFNNNNSYNGGNGDGNFSYMDKSTSASSTSSMLKIKILKCKKIHTPQVISKTLCRKSSQLSNSV